MRHDTAPLHLIFFFQAEDGIRDFHVTGVQTCALPIAGCAILPRRSRALRGARDRPRAAVGSLMSPRTMREITPQARGARAIANVRRGKRSSAYFAVQDAPCRGPSSARTRDSYAPRSPLRTASTAIFALTNASYIPSPESGSIRPAASPTSNTLSLANVELARRYGNRKPRRSLSAAKSIPCTSQSLRRWSRSRGPSLSQPPTPTLTWSPFGNTHA